jgi:nicotinamidase-related amidase
MPMDLPAVVAPGHTALVTQECQRGVIGDLSMLPDLAAAASASGMIARVAALARAARAAGVPVLHGVFRRRRDGLGANSNARLFIGTQRGGSSDVMVEGTPSVDVLTEIGVADSDIFVPRMHGLSPMAGTSLDAILRNLGVTTIVGVGVSVNVAMTNFAFDAVNAGYQFVLPRDAVAGFPAEYVEDVMRNTLSLVATLPTTDEVIAAWS